MQESKCNTNNTKRTAESVVEVGLVISMIIIIILLLKSMVDIYIGEASISVVFLLICFLLNLIAIGKTGELNEC